MAGSIGFNYRPPGDVTSDNYFRDYHRQVDEAKRGSDDEDQMPGVATQSLKTQARPVTKFSKKARDLIEHASICGFETQSFETVVHKSEYLRNGKVMPAKEETWVWIDAWKQNVGAVRVALIGGAWQNGRVYSPERTESLNNYTDAWEWIDGH